MREKGPELLDLSKASLETVFSDESLQDLSIASELEKIEPSSGGAWDGAKTPHVFEFNCNNSDGLANAKSRAMKRFERGLGINLVRSDDIELKPVSYCNRGIKIQRVYRLNIYCSSTMRSWN